MGVRASCTAADHRRNTSSAVSPSTTSANVTSRGRRCAVSTSSGSRSPASTAQHSAAARSPMAVTRTGSGSSVATVSGTHRAIGPCCNVSTAVHSCGAGSSGSTASNATRSSSARRTAPVRVANASAASVTSITAVASPHCSSASHRCGSSTTAAVPSGNCRCGSVAMHAHSSGWRVTTTIRTSAGPTEVANCTTADRATACAPGPLTATRAPGDRSSGTGRSAIGVSRSACDTVPRATDTMNASPCTARRDHTVASAP